MAVPKRRKSRSKTRHRKAQYMKKLKYIKEGLSLCPQCDAVKRPHHICPNCGYYKDAQIVTIKEKTK